MLGTQSCEQAHVVGLGVRTETVTLGGLLHHRVVLVDDVSGVRRVLVEGDAFRFAFLQAGTDGALAGLRHCREDRLLGLAGGINDDGSVVGDGLQGHHQIRVLVDGVQAHEDDGLVPLLDLAQQVRAQCGLTFGGRFLDPCGSPLGPQVMHASHRVLVEGDESDLGVVLAPCVPSPHTVPLGLFESLPHAGLFDGQGTVLETRDCGDFVFLGDRHERGGRHGVLVSRNVRSRVAGQFSRGRSPIDEAEAE